MKYATYGIPEVWDWDIKRLKWRGGGGPIREENVEAYAKLIPGGRLKWTVKGDEFFLEVVKI